MLESAWQVRKVGYIRIWESELRCLAFRPIPGRTIQIQRCFLLGVVFLQRGPLCQDDPNTIPEQSLVEYSLTLACAVYALANFCTAGQKGGREARREAPLPEAIAICRARVWNIPALARARRSGRGAWGVPLWLLVQAP